MLRIVVLGFVVAVGCLTVYADDSKAAGVKKLAQELGDATIKGDYGQLVDHTYDGVVKLLGGREKAIKTIEAAMGTLKGQGITIKSYTVGEPGPFLAEGDNTFVVVPSKLEMSIPGGKALAKSYLLGISSDEGKTWKFVDGAGMSNKEFREKGIPKLPAKLTLPENEKPEIIKDK